MISTEHAAELTATYAKKTTENSNKRIANVNNVKEVDLPDAEIGKVRLKFAPEPSGYLHIGHSKVALMNQYFAQRYNGKVLLGVVYGRK